MKKEIHLFYAVSKSGQGRVFVGLPERNETFGIWMGHSIGCISSLLSYFEAEAAFNLPDIKWKDNPVKLSLSVEY